VYPVLFHVGPIVVPSYGVLAALGALLALGLLMCTARLVGINPNQLWNLCILSLFAALIGSRALLIVLNWTVVRAHPAWLLGLAMVNHPLLAAIGAVFAIAAAVPYARAQRLPLWPTLDALAAPLSLALACEQVGALLAGSGYGSETAAPWAVVYTHPFAARWSGTPLFVPVHPVQTYAAVAFLLIAIAVWLWMPHQQQPGDSGGIALIAMGVTIFFTEFFRDPEGRGSLLNGAFNGPQAASVLLVLTGAVLLRDRKPTATALLPGNLEVPHE
jgi:phosphatidylglycerol---prolipoprotein diacylglyceryl transferase